MLDRSIGLSFTRLKPRLPFLPRVHRSIITSLQLLPILIVIMLVLAIRSLPSSFRHLSLVSSDLPLIWRSRTQILLPLCQSVVTGVIPRSRNGSKLLLLTLLPRVEVLLLVRLNLGF